MRKIYKYFNISFQGSRCALCDLRHMQHAICIACCLALAHQMANKSVRCCRRVQRNRKGEQKIKGMLTANFCKLIQTIFAPSRSRVRKRCAFSCADANIFRFQSFIAESRMKCSPLIEFIDTIYMRRYYNFENGFDLRQQFNMHEKSGHDRSTYSDVWLPQTIHLLTRYIRRQRRHNDRDFFFFFS